MKIPIERVQVGDRIAGKEVVDVLHRLHAHYIRVTLKGGDIVDGYIGKKMVEVNRRGCSPEAQL